MQNQELGSAPLLGLAEMGRSMCHPLLVAAPFMVPGTAFTLPSSRGTREFSPFPVLWGAVHRMASLTCWPFPSLTFMILIIAGVTAQLIRVIKRCGGDWFYNNSSDLWSTFHPRGSLLALWPCREELLLLPSSSHKGCSCSWAMGALYFLGTHENKGYVQLKSKRRVRQEGLRQ